MENIERVLTSIENIETLGTAADMNPRMPKLYVRNEYNQNPFELYSENEFKRRYRFFKHTVLNVILPLIITNLQPFNNRGLPILPQLQILIALRFYATGCFQMVCGDLNSISQSSVCLIVNKVSAELSKLLPRFVNFPRNMTTVKRKFEELGKSNTHHGLNNIIGAIDCTHIKINRPRGITHSEAYRNRKGYFSVNVQAIIGPDLEIFDIVTRWPGSSHDSRIFRNSQAYARLVNGELEGVLVGDSGYPALNFMLTPLLNPQTRADNNYNYSQLRTRNIVERFFGVWKKKFPCLQRGLRSKLTNTSNIIIACAVLHNIGIQRGDVYDDGDFTDQTPEVEQHRNNERSTTGLAFRQSVIAQFN
ncbi:putative nuclease HARBI1 [Pieris napi]|uniref:putative nuclease HARBI1 n=1 Tax=Pieris napi TaxID=78633 RepID=UPI001FBA9BB3|nr:putative nuclease HARBI1 [Pieris napi]